MATSRSSNDKKTEGVQKSFPLFNLPPEVCQKYVYPNFPLKECGIFASLSIQGEAGTAFYRLLTSAADAEPESYKESTQKDPTNLAAIAILKRHPELLFRTGVVKDHFGRKIEASPYRLFLGAGDTWALKQVHELILPKIENGNAIAQTQFHKQFPYFDEKFDSENPNEEAFYDNRNIEMIKQVKAQLQVIVAKITVDPCTDGLATLDETKQEVEALRQIFIPKKDEVIQTGLHFPLAIMQEVLYCGCVSQIQPWGDAQSAFFSREVIGSTLVASTALDSQYYKNGLENLENMKENGPDRQDGLFCTNPKGIPPNLTPLNNKLGRTMFVDPSLGESCFLSFEQGYFDWYDKNGVRSFSDGGCVFVLGGGLKFLYKLMQNKSRDIGAIMQPHTVNTCPRKV